MESTILGYEPIDLNDIIKSLPKGLKKISTDKDLESEISDICMSLKDLSKL